MAHTETTLSRPPRTRASPWGPRPAGMTPKLVTALTWHLRTARQALPLRLHTRAVVSSLAVKSRRRPGTGWKAVARTGASWPRNTWVQCPRRVSHTRAERSALPVACARGHRVKRSQSVIEKARVVVVHVPAAPRWRHNTCRSPAAGVPSRRVWTRPHMTRRLSRHQAWPRCRRPSAARPAPRGSAPTPGTACSGWRYTLHSRRGCVCPNRESRQGL